MAVPLATRLAEKLGLPGNTPAAVDAARDKYATRTKLQEVGLPNPKNFLISEPQHVKQAAAHVGFPSGAPPPAKLWLSWLIDYHPTHVVGRTTV
jgi:carbamoylphosphate synthase large subunit